MDELMEAIADSVFEQTRVNPTSSGAYFIRYQVDNLYVELNACRNAERWSARRLPEDGPIRLFVDVYNLDGIPVDEGETPNSPLVAREYTVSDWNHAADRLVELIGLLQARQIEKLTDLASELEESVRRCVT